MPNPVGITEDDGEKIIAAFATFFKEEDLFAAEDLLEDDLAEDTTTFFDDNFDLVLLPFFCFLVDIGNFAKETFLVLEELTFGDVLGDDLGAACNNLQSSLIKLTSYLLSSVASVYRIKYTFELNFSSTIAAYQLDSPSSSKNISNIAPGMTSALSRTRSAVASITSLGVGADS